RRGAHSARASMRARAPGRRRPPAGPSLVVLHGGLGTLQMGAGDLRPRAAEVELEIAAPVSGRGLIAAKLAEHAGQVEMRVGVVRLHLQREPVPGDRGMEVAQVLVERAQVERRLAAAVVGAERLLIALPGALV